MSHQEIISNPLKKGHLGLATIGHFGLVQCFVIGLFVGCAVNRHQDKAQETFLLYRRGHHLIIQFFIPFTQTTFAILYIIIYFLLIYYKRII